ncbi:hypothetical protein ACLB2K_022736 [Fragaria x ananassa]
MTTIRDDDGLKKISGLVLLQVADRLEFAAIDAAKETVVSKPRLTVGTGLDLAAIVAVVPVARDRVGSTVVSSRLSSTKAGNPNFKLEFRAELGLKKELGLGTFSKLQGEMTMLKQWVRLGALGLRYWALQNSPLLLGFRNELKRMWGTKKSKS